MIEMMKMIAEDLCLSLFSRRNRFVTIHTRVGEEEQASGGSLSNQIIKLIYVARSP